MDPLSIAASSCAIAGLCGSIILNVGRFMVGVREVPQSLVQFHNSITVLNGVLSRIESVVRQQPKPLPFAQQQEEKHWKDIKDILEACSQSLYRLKQELPDALDGDPRLLRQMLIQVDMTMKSTLFIEIRGHISSYTQILQLSLTTMTLGSIWETQQSQNELRLAIQDLTSKMQATDSILNRRPLNSEVVPLGNLSVEEISAMRNIDAWRESAYSLADAVTNYEADQQSIDGRAEDRVAWNSLDSTRANDADYHELSERQEPRSGTMECDRSMSQPDSGFEDDDATFNFDPERHNTYTLSVDVLQYQIEANQTNVKKFLESGLYVQAEQAHTEGIELQNQLLEQHQVPFPGRMDAEETLADILIMKKGTRDSLSRAKDILQKLLQQEVDRNLGPDEDKSRRWRLYHKLSAIYIEFGFIEKAKDFAIRAMEGRKALQPVPLDLVLESANLLVKTYQKNLEIHKAEGLRRWINEKERDLPGSSTTDHTKPFPPDSMADVLHWCRLQGFEVDSASFYFEQANADGRTPLHVAVLDERLDMVEQIVDHVKTLESRDNDLATALMLACATRNRRTVDILLKKGAKVNVQDKGLNSPLHRVQYASGGIAVARLLLDHTGQTIAIDLKNAYEKTALHLACEMGNEPMVTFLLDCGADINASGPAKCTPLHLAIYSRRISIVKKLLDRHADINVRDSYGRDAIAAAKQGKSPSPDIKRFLHEHEHRLHSERVRRLSHASTDSNAQQRTSLSPSEWTRRDISTTLVEGTEQAHNYMATRGGISVTGLEKRETMGSVSSGSSGVAVTATGSEDPLPLVSGTGTTSLSKFARSSLLQLRWPRRERS